MYPNLRAELARREIKNVEVAACIKVSEKTLYNKLTGRTPLNYEEAVLIKRTFAPGADIEQLFCRAQDSG